MKQYLINGTPIKAKPFGFEVFFKQLVEKHGYSYLVRTDTVESIQKTLKRPYKEGVTAMFSSALSNE